MDTAAYVPDRAMVDARDGAQRQHERAGSPQPGCGVSPQETRGGYFRVSHGSPSLLLHSQILHSHTDTVTARPSTTVKATRLPIEVTSPNTLPFGE